MSQISEFIEQLQAWADSAGDPAEMLLRAELGGNDELEWLAGRAALPRWFDGPMLDCLLPDTMKYEPDMDGFGQGPDHVGELLRLAFVQEMSRPAAWDESIPTRYRMDKAVRAHLLKEWEAEPPEDFVETNQRLRDLFRERAEGADASERRSLQQEALYHQFAVDESQALEEFRRLFDHAESTYQLGVGQALVNIAEEQEHLFRGSTTLAWLRYYQGRNRLLQGDWKPARSHFEETLKLPGVPRGLRGLALAGLGDVHRTQGDWAKAIQAYEGSLDTFLNVRTALLVQTYFERAEGGVRLLAGLPGSVTRRVTMALWRFVGLVTSSRLRQSEIRQGIAECKEPLEVARVFIRTGDLALAMSRCRVTLSQLEREIEGAAEVQRILEKAKDEAGVPAGEGKFGRVSLRQMLAAARAMRQEAKGRAEDRAAEAKKATGTKPAALEEIVRERLLAYAQDMYRKAIEILERGGEAQDEPEPLRAEYAWDVQFGLASALLAQGEHEEARSLYEGLLATESHPYQQARVTLALGDCDLAAADIVGATERYRQAVAELRDTWDRPQLAQGLLRLGRALALQSEWRKAIASLQESRTILAQLRDLRGEEEVQETLREIARSADLPEELAPSLQEDREGWGANLHAYPASAQVLRRIRRAWILVFAVLGVVLAAAIFLLVRAFGMWALGRFGAQALLDLWWLNAAVFMVCLFYALMVLENSSGLRRRFGRRMPLDVVWGSQPGLVAADDKGLTQTNYAGEVRRIAWDEVDELRQGHSSDWVSAGASILASGTAGGRTALLAPQGALSFDADIHSYAELCGFVEEQIPQERHNSREFTGTFRGMAMWGVILLYMFACLGCPIAAVLSLGNSSGWIIALKAIVGGVAALFAVAFAFVIGWQLLDSVRFYRFMDPKRLPDPPPPVDRARSAESCLIEERRSAR